jgi:hypothetical protein
MLGLSVPDLCFVSTELLRLNLYLILALLAVFVMKRRRRIAYLLREKRVYFLVLAVLFFVGLSLRLFMARPAMLSENHHTYVIMELAASDEMVYCRGYYPNGPVFVFRLFSQYLQGAPGNFFAINALLGSLSIILVYICTYSISKSNFAALLSSLLLTLFPVYIKYSNSDVVEISSTLFFLLLLYMLYTLFNPAEPLKSGKYLETALTALVFSFAIQLRPENVSFVGLVLPFLLLYAFRLFSSKDKVQQKEGSVQIMLFLVLVGVFTLHWVDYLNSLRENIYPTGLPYLTLESFMFRLAYLGEISLFTELFLGIALIAGMIYAARKHFFALAALASFVLMKLLVDSSFTDIRNFAYGDLRDHLPLFAPLLIICALGLHYAWQRLGKKESDSGARWVWFGVISLLLVGVLFSADVVFIRADSSNWATLEFNYLTRHLSLMNGSVILVNPGSGRPNASSVYDYEPLLFFSKFADISIFRSGDYGYEQPARVFFYLGPSCFFGGRWTYNSFEKTGLVSFEDGSTLNVSESCAESLSNLSIEGSYLESHAFTRFFTDTYYTGKNLTLGLVEVKRR